MKIQGEALSASEIQLGRECLRKWAARYATDDWPADPHDHAARSGKVLHAHAEAYLRTGTLPRVADVYSEAFLEGLPYLPHPGTALSIEQEERITIDGLPFVLFADLVVRASDGVPAVIDHKTSKNPRAYGLWSRAKFADNPQALIYDYAALTKYNPARVHNRWVYYHKTKAMLAQERAWYVERGGSDPQVLQRMERGIKAARAHPKAEPSDCTLTAEEIRGGIERVVLPVASELYSLRSKRLDPLELPPNPDECEKKGGCPHRNRCNLQGDTGLRAAFGAVFGGNTDMAQNGIDFFKSLPPVNGPGVPASQPTAPQQTAFNFAAPPATPAPATPAPATPAPATPAPATPAPFTFSFNPPAPAPVPAPAAAPAATAPVPVPAAAAAAAPVPAPAPADEFRMLLRALGRAMLEIADMR